MKKIAILNDIHGNLYALKKALEYLRDKNISFYLFGGDLITDGPDSTKIIETIKGLPSYCILGNRELSMLEYEKTNKEQVTKNRPMFYIYNNLTKSDLDFLHTLSPYQIIEIENKKICLSHGSPYNVRDNIYPHKTDIFDQLIKDFNCDIYLFGHIHTPFSIIYKDRYFINAGAINCNIFTPSQTSFGILTINDTLTTYDHILLKYPFAEVKEYYLNSPYFNYNPEWSNIILYNIKSGYNYSDDFSKNYDPNKSYRENYQQFMHSNKLNIIKNK